MRCRGNFIQLLLILVLICCSLPKLWAQVDDFTWKADYNSMRWNDFVSTLEKQYPVYFFYESDSLPNFSVFLAENIPGFTKKLNAILAPFDHKAVMDNAGHIFITRHTAIQTSVPEVFFDNSGNILPENKPAANKENANRNEFLPSAHTYVDQRLTVGKLTNDNRTRVTISGYVKSSSDNSPLIGVLLRIEGTNSAVMTDVSGYYAMNVEKGNQLLIAGNLETKERRINLKVLSDGRLDLMLEPKLVTLNAVVISAGKEQLVKSTQMGYQRLSTKEIKEIPLVLGEQDVIKVSLLLPGVQSVGEGSAGLNVRGSPSDQNSFIINDIPVYNASHLLGFFSAFNSDAIEDFALYKSNIPANLGGRLSSVFDIKTKQGNQQHFTANGGISPITAKLVVEGPIRKRKSSYMVGLRSTYSDWILKQVDDPAIKNSDAFFADAVTDFSLELNKDNRLRLSSYHSVDQINLMDENNYNYTNHGASLSWGHLIREKNNFQLALIYSQYNFTEKNEEIEISSYQDEFGLKHGELQAGLTLRPNGKHTVSVGFNTTLYLLNQGDFSPLNDESLVTPLNLEKEKALESALYLSDEWVINQRLTLVGGIRYNQYVYLGPQQVKIYGSSGSRSEDNITDTISYTDNQVIKTYGAPDLRFAARLMISDKLSVKASFNQLHQYLFMLSNTIAVSPTDKWKLCDYHIKPMAGNQYSIGIYHTMFKGKYELSVETYYKTVKNLIEYKNGANLIVNESPEMDIVQGDLESYGVEFMISKTKGRFNGWLNYTYSRALVTLNSVYPEERINSGKPYAANYDKPHALNIVANYKFSRRFSLSSNLVYSTGRPITYPVGFYFQDNVKIPLYSLRNEYRIPDYFRVDMSLKLEGNLASKKFAHGTWIFSVYNLTGRRNAYSVFFKQEESILSGYKLSIFAVPIVSLTYSFKLGNYAD